MFFRGFRGQKLCRCEEQGEICGRLVEVSKETHQLGKFFQEILLQQTASHSIIFYCVTSLSLCLLYSHLLSSGCRSSGKSTSPAFTRVNRFYIASLLALSACDWSGESTEFNSVLIELGQLHVLGLRVLTMSELSGNVLGIIMLTLSWCEGVKVFVLRAVVTLQLSDLVSAFFVFAFSRCKVCRIFGPGASSNLTILGIVPAVLKTVTDSRRDSRVLGLRAVSFSLITGLVLTDYALMSYVGKLDEMLKEKSCLMQLSYCIISMKIKYLFTALPRWTNGYDATFKIHINYNKGSILIYVTSDTYITYGNNMYNTEIFNNVVFFLLLSILNSTIVYTVESCIIFW